VELNAGGTGTAQWFAELLRKDLRGKKIKADVVSLDSYDPVRLFSCFAVTSSRVLWHSVANCV
jgi:hypothetical protein